MLRLLGVMWPLVILIVLTTGCRGWLPSIRPPSGNSGNGALTQDRKESRRRANPMEKPNAPKAQLKALDWITCALLFATIASAALLFTPYGSLLTKTTPIAFGVATVLGFLARWFVINSEAIIDWTIGTAVTTLAIAGAVAVLRRYRNKSAEIPELLKRRSSDWNSAQKVAS